MKRYVVEYPVFVEVEAEDQWEAYEKAFDEIEKGGLELSEPNIVECWDIDEGERP